MSRIDRWFAERPRRAPAEIACALARDKFWRDERLRLIGTHPDWPEAASLLGLDTTVAHALVLVLSRLPVERRRDFAGAFYAERGERAAELPTDAQTLLAVAAAAVLQVVELANAVVGERVLDLLNGAAQRDDISLTSPAAVDEVRKTVARIRLEPAYEDASDPTGAAALAVAEVLDPAGDVVAVKEVVARCAWAAVESWSPPRVLAFLLAVDEAVTNRRARGAS